MRTGCAPTLDLIIHEPSATCGMIFSILLRTSSVPFTNLNKHRQEGKVWRERVERYLMRSIPCIRSTILDCIQGVHCVPDRHGACAVCA